MLGSIEWAQMRLHRGLKQYGLVLLALPGLLLLTGISTLADASPTPPASGNAALPGDPNNGQTVYQQNCATCHGNSLEGGIGATLNPIDKLPNVANLLDPTFLIGVITNGRVHQTSDPKQTDMPAWQGKLTDQEIKDVAAYIIQQNQLGAGNAPLSQGELAKRTMLWVGIGIIAMVFVTYLLAQYNMRWIARRAAARRR
jgi:mono/diheme cytochrome c family protein